MLILAQFLLRAAWGLAAALALTSPKKVTSGFFRNHSYVLLGIFVVAALAAFKLTAGAEELDVLPRYIMAWPAVFAALLSYASSAAWLYEKPRLGRTMLAAIAIAPLFACGAGLFISNRFMSARDMLEVSAPITGGLLLGGTLAAMFLGHWYLNTPTMELAPLRRLVLLLIASAAARAMVCGAGLACELWSFYTSSPMARGPLPAWPFLALRWLAGIVGPIVLGIMAWKTLKIPNTQSATGILYVAVIVVFIGELTSLLLSVHAVFPL